MKNLFYTASAVIVGLIVGGFIGYALHTSSLQVGTTTAGGTTSTAQFYSIAIDMTALATSSSILNPTGNDLYVTSIQVGCEGIGTSKSYLTGSSIASLTFTAATSSASTPVTTPPTTYAVGGGSTNISTSTGTFLISSTTASTGSTAITNIWPASAYMTFYHNATSTGACTAGVHAFSS